MFDFLASEVWWMETIIAAIITAITTYLLATSKMKKGIERINEILDKANFVETKVEFSKEHTNLSNDHKSLSRDHSDLLEKMSDVSKTATFLKDETIKTKAVREEVSKRELNPQMVVDTITALTTELVELKAENADLKTENANLRNQLQQRNKVIDRNFGYDLDR